MKQFKNGLLNRAKQMVYDRDKEGFTLIELIVVMAIIAVLVLLASPMFLGRTNEANKTKHVTNAKILEDAAERYFIDEQDWPRLTDDAYTSEEIKSYSERVLNVTGEEVTLDPEGNYYDIDYEALGKYVKVPSDADKNNYILRNPIGKIYYMEGLTKEGSTRVDYGSNADKEAGEVTNENLPGSPTSIADNGDVKFFGEVPASELYTASEIASAVGIKQGTAQHENEPWLKFEIDGSIIYRPRKAIRHSISWDTINAAGAALGAARVTKNGVTYKVRLMKGLHDDNPSISSGSSNHGSEWNRLMLPIHEQAIDGSWAYKDNVEDDIIALEHTLGTGPNGRYTDADLLTHHNHGAGSTIWMQERNPTSLTQSITRGYFGVAYSGRKTSSYTGTNRGWAPVLEVVE